MARGRKPKPLMGLVVTGMIDGKRVIACRRSGIWVWLPSGAEARAYLVSYRFEDHATAKRMAAKAGTTAQGIEVRHAGEVFQDLQEVSKGGVA
jgi:hypothetical protein